MVAVFSFPYLVPIAVLFFDKLEYRKSGLEIVLLLRFVENVVFGILAAVFGKTACGESLAPELCIYFGLLAANALAIVLFQCCLDDDGKFAAPRSSTYSPNQILGRAMDTE